MNIQLHKMQMHEFPIIYKLMQASFPPSEFRTYEGELALFDYTNYRVLVAKKDGEIKAFIAEWIFDTFHYVEHFAVSPTLRGKGLGSGIFKQYIETVGAPVVIEVEDSNTLEATRRIEFYERLHFKLSDIQYLQPTLRPLSDPVSLRLMVYPSFVTNEALQLMKEDIFTGVYANVG